MSSYGSMSPSDEGFDRYEPPFYCPPSHQVGAMDNAVFWPATNGEGPDFDSQEIYHDTTHYIGRSYGYEEMQISSNEPYDGYHHNIHHAFGQNTGGIDCEQIRYDRPAPSFVRVVKRRTTANKKERRRTQSINTAFSDLRECIPNVPPDTKLSKVARKSTMINSAYCTLRNCIPHVLADTKMTKIKTLRLATSYISYLLKVLETDGEPAGGFRADLHHTPTRRRNNDQIFQMATLASANIPDALQNLGSPNNILNALYCFYAYDTHKAQQSAEKRGKGRTGWPQHVWALELKSEQNLQT